MSIDQDLVFQQAEGDAWFRRNASALDTAKPDAVLQLLQQINVRRLDAVRSVCDVGSANGWRLARLAERLPGASQLCGFDASAEAVAAGQSAFPRLILRTGMIDEPPFDDQFDLVVVSFVLHWVDRERLARAVAAVDRLVAPDGMLVVSDFLPDRPCARRYHHREDVELFTYKQDYVATFTGLGLYREIARLTFSHDQHGLDVGPAGDQDRAVCAVLHKSSDTYPVS